MNREELAAIYERVSVEICGGTEWCWHGIAAPLERFAALVAAEEAKVTSEQEPLARFYGVTSKDELIAALEQHILKVQAKLPPLRDEQPRKIREG